MQFIEFPEAVAKASAESAKVAYAKRGPFKVGASKTEKGLAFKTPCGKIRPVYDPYRPQYPSDCTPGRADITKVAKWYPNDTNGYEFYCANFEPL